MVPIQTNEPDSGMSMMSQENFTQNGHQAQSDMVLENAPYYGPSTGIVNSGMEEETY